MTLGNIKKSCKNKSEFTSLFSTMLSMNKYNVIKMDGGYGLEIKKFAYDE